MAIPKFERFFRVAADVDVDKSDLRRFSDFVFDQIYDMLIIGQARAKANDRDVLQPWDLSITKGLQERMHEFEKIDVFDRYNKPFKLTAVDENGIVLQLGRQEAWTRLSWACLESVPTFLASQGGWVAAGGQHNVGGEPGTLDEHLKGCLKRDVARWLADDNMVVVSLTHVRVPRTLPFAPAAHAYQKHRVKKLRKQGSA